jgi:DNA-binding protein HU-beta
MATAKPLTQAQIIDKLAGTVDLPKNKIKELLSAQAELAYKEAAKGYTVAGLGKVIKVKRKARMGRNPATGESIKIPAKTVLKFRISKIAKDAITPAKK